MAAARKSGRKANNRVGKGNPPRATQFRKGVSGNPRGRPKGTKNIARVIVKELNKPVVVTENGTRRRIDKTTAVVKRMIQRALEGDQKSVSNLLSLVERNSAEEPAEEPPTKFEINLLRKYFSYLEGLLDHADELDRSQAA